MTFADSVLHLVRAGAHIDPSTGLDAADSQEALAISPVEDIALDYVGPDYEPGMADLEAAVGLVSTGLARRVVLAGFKSWPGLLWRAYQLADSAGVLILPAVVRPGGVVDIVITRETGPDG